MTRRLRRRATITAAVTAAIATAAISPALAAAPTAVTSPPDASLITDTYGLLSGIVNPNGAAVLYHFEYGPTTSYGTSTPDTSASNGKAEVPVDYSLEDLTPATTYHYRIVVTGDGSQDPKNAQIPPVVGTDQSFTTSPALAVSVTRASGRVDETGRTKFVLTAVGPTDEVAKGKIKLVATFKTSDKAKAKTRTIATKAYSLKVGQFKAIKLKVGAVARKYLAENGTLKTTASVGKTVTQKLTLKG